MAANALKLKVPSPTGSQTAASCIQPDEKALAKYLPDLCVFGRFRAHSFATDFEGRTPEEPLFMRIAERSKARTWLG